MTKPSDTKLSASAATAADVALRAYVPAPLLEGLEAVQEQESLQQLFELLQQRTGASFFDYKPNTVMRRIERRMKLRQFDTLARYVAYLHANQGEVELLFKEMLIGVTRFFRDPDVWEHLKQVAIPRLLADHPDGGTLRAWVPACSTGEEAYSLAILFREVLDQLRPKAIYTLQIFATDLDADAIGRARKGQFGAAIESELSKERLLRYFVAADHGGYRILKSVRNTIVFAQQNVISDPPFTRLDLLCCRNLLIYFNPRLHEQLIPLFHYALNPGGLLMFGRADTPGRFTELFEPMAGASRIYQRLDAPPRLPNGFPTRVRGAPPPLAELRADGGANLQRQVERLLLARHTPAALLLNARGDVLHIHGRTGASLEAAAGKVNWNIHALARPSLRAELATLLRRAGAASGPVLLRGVRASGDGVPAQTLDIGAEVLGEDDAPGGLAGLTLLTFADAAPLPQREPAATPRLQALASELESTRRELASVHEQVRASRQALEGSQDELRAANEELQSAKEELSTSKEEMEALNEELCSVNDELHIKLRTLSRLNDDLKNLLNSTDIATVFLDSALRIRRYTTEATRIFRLIASDLERPLSDIVCELEYPTLLDDVGTVLHTLQTCERRVWDGERRRHFTARILPYRTVENVVDGVVLTFIRSSPPALAAQP
ncbi:PAS domain-containing protein [Oxalobacteraceae bacterium]|nr:PAS domain-containing protein [Oxalobacteraceae bacterium]